MPLYEHAELPSTLRTLYPRIEPYETGMLKVSEVHRIYYEQSGNPNGCPIVFLHGGPGAGTSADHRRFFDPAHYRIILFDQRGAGKSTPHASLIENTTWHLVSDIEAIRQHLGIERWIVFGGSWGSTLAMTYAISHPDKVLGLILRGIFTCKQYELDFLYKEGASYVFPDAWEDFTAMIPQAEHGDFIKAYHRLLTGLDAAQMQKAAIAWTRWEASTNRLVPDPLSIASMTEDQFALSFARAEIHYFINRGFFPTDNYLIENIGKIRHIPTVMIHGRYDLVIPLRAAWDLHRAWPEAEFHVVPNAGHSASEPGIAHLLLQATDKCRKLWG